MNNYIIDGNNLIGRIKPFMQLQKKDKQASREKLVQLISRYFSGKKIKLSLHFDGHPRHPIPISKGKIFYSLNETSDTLIRKEIEKSPNPKLIVLITSDNELMNYGKAYSCRVVTSGEFYKEIQRLFIKNDEAEKIKQLEKEKDNFLKLFLDNVKK